MQAALVHRLTGPQAARAGRFALVIGAHLLVLLALLRIPEMRPPAEAQIEPYEITFFEEPRRPVEPKLGTVEPKLKKPEVELPPLPQVRIPDVPATVATLPAPSVRSESLVAAAPSVPQPGVGAETAGPAGGSDHPTLIVSEVDPIFSPRRALLEGVEHGSVLVGMEVDPQGRLIHVKVLRSSGSAEFDRAAVAAVRRWKFRAAAKGGQPIKMSKEFNFSVLCGPAPRPGQPRKTPHASCLERSRAAGAWRFQR